MSVVTTGVAITYNGDGFTSIFAYPYYLWDPTTLIVSSTLNGVTTLYALNAQPGFTFSGATDLYGAFAAGGNIKIVDGAGNPSAPAAGSKVALTRVTPKTQQISFLDGNAFPATTLEHGLDKACLWAQEQSLFQGVVSAAPAGAGTQIGQWYQNGAAGPGDNFGWVWTGAAWSPFGIISL